MSAAAAGSRVIADLRGLRVLIVHEWLYAWAGAERCLEQMFEVFPDADLLVGVITREMRDYNDICSRARETWVGRLPRARTRHRWFLPLHAVAFATTDTSPYDLVISSSHAFEKFVRPRAGTRHLCYCYSPPRFLWGMQHAYEKRAGAGERLMLHAAGPTFRFLDQRAARGVHRFASISRYIAERVRTSYGRDSDVVYPPVAAKAAVAGRPAGRAEPYLLYIGRLVEYKRIDLLIRAAERLQVRLVVAGDGPERAALERIAGRWTELRGTVSEHEAAALLTHCAAFVFAGEEDFGIALVEANAHGRPVVCFGRGGALETMVPDETAILFDAQDEASIVQAVTKCLSRSWDHAVLRRNADRFAPERFRNDFTTAVRRTLSTPKE